MPGGSHYAARRRRGATLRQGRGAVTNTLKSRQNRYPDMEEALNQSQDGEIFSENATGPKRRTSSGPGAYSQRDPNVVCKCEAGCTCSPAAVGDLEQPAAKTEPEGPKEIDSARNIYQQYSICDDCRARLGKDFDVRAESCALALLELRYGSAAREANLASGDGGRHGERERPVEHFSGVRRTPPKPLRRTLVVSSGASDLDQARVSLLKGAAKRRRKCSCGAAGTSTICQCQNAATTGPGNGPGGRSATVSRPSPPAAAGACVEPQSSSGSSTTAVMIQLPAKDEAGDEPNGNPPSVAAPVLILPTVVLAGESSKSAKKEECPSRE